MLVPFVVFTVAHNGAAAEPPVCASENNASPSCANIDTDDDVDVDAKKVRTTLEDNIYVETFDTLSEVEYEPNEIEWCRRRPAWRNWMNLDGVSLGDKTDKDISENCQNVLGYVPNLEDLTKDKDIRLSSNYERDTSVKDKDESWSKEGIYDSLPVLERPLIRDIRECMDGILATSEHRGGKTTGTLKQPSVARLIRRKSDGEAVMAVVENALGEEEAEVVKALATCTKKFIPENFERREFDNTDLGGGNDVTFMAGFLQLLAPGVTRQVQKVGQVVWNKAGWSKDDVQMEPLDVIRKRNEEEEYHRDKPAPPTSLDSEYSTRRFPDPMSECGIRTTEHLSYDTWGALGYHNDGDSDYTVLVAMSNPEDYEGGAFGLCPNFDTDLLPGLDHHGGPDCPGKVSVKPDRHSAIVFLSEFEHGVEDINTPGRVMFTNELWRYGHVPATAFRPGVKGYVLNEDDDFFNYGNNDPWDDGDDDDDDDMDYDSDEFEDGDDVDNDDEDNEEVDEVEAMVQ